MSAVLKDRRQSREAARLWAEHLTQGNTFLTAVLDCPLRYAFYDEKQLQRVRDTGASYRSLAVLRAEADQDTEAARGLMQMLADWTERKAQTPAEKAVGKWLHRVISERVDELVEDAAERGDFL